jgi:hypothetical protein
MQRFKIAREAIGVAQTPESVSDLLNRCMSTVPSDWLGAMPQTCQHIIALRTPDITAAAIDMMRMEMVFTGGGEAGRVLHEIAQTYGVAAARIAKLHR